MNQTQKEVEAITYAVLILDSMDIEITETRIRTILDSAGMKVSPHWITAYCSFFKKNNIKDMIVRGSMFSGSLTSSTTKKKNKKKEIVDWQEYCGTGLYKKYSNERLRFEEIYSQIHISDTHTLISNCHFFKNDSDKHFEVVYKFATSPFESVYQVVVKFTDKNGKVSTLVSEIYRKQKALEMNDDVISSGNTAILIEKESNDVCSLALGNFAPGYRCEVSVYSVQEVKIMEKENGLTSFKAILPSLYDSEEQRNIVTNITRLDITFHLNQQTGTTRIVDMKSYHDINITDRSDRSWTAFATNVKMTCDFDVVVVVENYPHSIFFHSIPSKYEKTEKKHEEMKKHHLDLLSINFKEEEKYLLEDSMNNNQIPSETIAAPQKLFLELIFVIDRSGSMSGGRMNKAVDTMKLVFSSLDEEQEIFFNIVSFGSQHSYLYKNSRRFCSDSLQNVMGFLGKMNANMGGTDIYSPVNRILESKKVFNRRCIYLLTDGEDGRTNDILNCVKEKSKETKIMSFGIGQEIDDVLIKGVAEYSGGEYVFIRNNNEIHEAVMTILNKTLESEVSSVEIRFNGELLNLVCHSQYSKNQRFLGWVQNDIVGGKEEEEEGDVMRVHYEIGNNKYCQEMPIENVERALDFGWERMSIRRRMMMSNNSKNMNERLIDLCLIFELLSKDTSFFMEYQIEDASQGEGLLPTRLYTPKFRVEEYKKPESAEAEEEEGDYSDGDMGVGLFGPGTSSEEENLGLGLFGGGSDSDDSDDSDSSDGFVKRKSKSSAFSIASIQNSFVRSDDATTSSSESSPLIAILLQVSIRGFWRLTESIGRFLGDLSVDEIRESVPQQFVSRENSLDVWVTCLVIQYLLKNYSQDEIKWKLIVQKSLRNIKNDGFESMIDFAKQFMASRD